MLILKHCSYNNKTIVKNKVSKCLTKLYIVPIVTSYFKKIPATRTIEVIFCADYMMLTILSF